MRTLDVVGTALHETRIRGGPLFLMYVFIGLVTGLLSWFVGPGRSVILVPIFALCWVTGFTVSLNVFRDDDEDHSIADMYENDYRGLGWSVLHMLGGLFLYAMVVLLPLAVAFVVGESAGEPVVAVVNALSAGEGLVPATVGYAVLQVLFVTISLYMALGGVLFPVFISFDFRNAFRSLEQSFRMTWGETCFVTFPHMIGATILFGTVYAGLSMAGGLRFVKQVTDWTLLHVLSEWLVFSVFAGVGMVLFTALLVATYEETEE
jgi:hypothetical protein